MRALGTVAVVVCTLVVNLCHCDVEHTLGSLNLRRYLWEIGDLQRCSVLVDDVHHIDVMEMEFSIFNHEFILRKFKCLINQINVLVLHFNKAIKLVYLFYRTSDSLGFSLSDTKILFISIYDTFRLIYFGQNFVLSTLLDKFA